jgi:hypothetical protein
MSVNEEDEDVVVFWQHGRLAFGLWLDESKVYSSLLLTVAVW